MKKSLLLFILLAGIIAGCNKEELKVAYLNFSESTTVTMDVSTFNQEHGTNYDASELASIANQRFPDIWVFADGTSLGTWERPCKVPVIFTENDSINLSLYPGVKMNGVSTMRPRYPFVVPHTITTSFTNGEVMDVNQITFKYAATTHFEFIENFTKDYNSVFYPSTENGINFGHIADPDEPINRIGEISLTDTVMDFEVISSDMTFGNILPADVFLEMDYRCDVEAAEFTVTMLVDKSTTSATTSEPLVIANAGPQWKKIYVNLTKSIHRNSTNAIRYRVQLSGGRDDSNPVHLYFDNIKVIYLTSY